MQWAKKDLQWLPEFVESLREQGIVTDGNLVVCTATENAPTGVTVTQVEGDYFSCTCSGFGFFGISFQLVHTRARL